MWCWQRWGGRQGVLYLGRKTDVLEESELPRTECGYVGVKLLMDTFRSTFLPQVPSLSQNHTPDLSPPRPLEKYPLLFITVFLSSWLIVSAGCTSFQSCACFSWEPASAPGETKSSVPIPFIPEGFLPSCLPVDTYRSTGIPGWNSGICETEWKQKYHSCIFSKFTVTLVFPSITNMWQPTGGFAEAMAWSPIESQVFSYHITGVTETPRWCLAHSDFKSAILDWVIWCTHNECKHYHNSAFFTVLLLHSGILCLLKIKLWGYP